MDESFPKKKRCVSRFIRFLSKNTGCRFIFFFCLAPLILTYFLYGFPWSRLPLVPPDLEKCENTFRLVSKPKEGSIKYFLIKLFQVPFGLSWYELCLSNKNEVYMEGKAFDQKLDKEAGALSYTFNIFNNVTSSIYLYSQVGENYCSVFSYNGVEDLVGSLQLITVRQPVVRDSSPVCTKGNYIDYKNTSLYVKNNIFAYLLRLLAIFTVWSVSILSLRKLWESASGEKNKK